MFLIENAIEAVAQGYDPEEVVEAMIQDRIGSVQEQLVDPQGNPVNSAGKSAIGKGLARFKDRVSQKAREQGRGLQWRGGQASQKARELGSTLMKNKGKVGAGVAAAALGAGLYAAHRRKKNRQAQD